MPVEKRSHDTSNSSLPYIFSSANSNKPAPLVLFLHGAKDRGTDINVLLKKWGFPLFVDSSPSLPYVFVAPQLPEGQTWVGRAEDV
ncbi:MAG: phospholipase, partial [Dolichospermum sp.]